MDGDCGDRATTVPPNQTRSFAAAAASGATPSSRATAIAAAALSALCRPGTCSDSGKLPAAVVMGRMRSVLRGYALDCDGPAETLDRLDRKFAHFEPKEMATVLYAVAEPTLDGWWSRILLDPQGAVVGVPPGQAHDELGEVLRRGWSIGSAESQAAVQDECVEGIFGLSAQ